MIKATTFAGFGGQGVLLMGYVLCYGAMLKGLNLTYYPSYGAEMRGGTANCTVTVADKPIASPVASRPDFLVAMNTPSLDKFETQVADNGVVFLNGTLVDREVKRTDVDVVNVPLVQLAEEAGSPRSANMVMIGVFAAKTGLMTLDETVAGMKAAMKGKDKFFPLNQAGIERGFKFVTEG